MVYKGHTQHERDTTMAAPFKAATLRKVETRYEVTINMDAMEILNIREYSRLYSSYDMARQAVEDLQADLDASYEDACK
jgi:hypothetical protein